MREGAGFGPASLRLRLLLFRMKRLGVLRDEQLYKENASQPLICRVIESMVCVPGGEGGGEGLLGCNCIFWSLRKV